MLGKLIKHELRATARTMLPLFAVLSVMAVLAGFSMRQLEFQQDMPAFVELVMLIVLMMIVKMMKKMMMIMIMIILGNI